KVPPLFNQIKGGLLLLNEGHAASLIDALRAYVAERILADQALPADASLDDLADVISSVEYYLENLREGRVFGSTVLDVAAKSLEQLGCRPEPYKAGEAAEPRVESIDLSDVAAPPDIEASEAP